ncbi:MAG: cytochrome c nitrite reductase small subunit [Candidatus Sumerlaeia bacterium]
MTFSPISRVLWMVVFPGVLFGALTGVGTFTFYYAKGASYMTNDPGACANCHVMNEQYNAWTKSSHHAVATCNDCHTPHNLAGKLATKALNGWNHSLAFTTGRFHEPIQITDRNRRITESACRSCHEPIVLMIDRHGEQGGGAESGRLSCIECHRSVGHLH